MRLSWIFATALVVGVGAGYVLDWPRIASREQSPAVTRTEPSPKPVAAANAPVATPRAEKPDLSVAPREESERADGKPPLDAEAVERAESKASRLAKRDNLTRDDVKGLLQKVLAGRLPDRELSDSDYDRLADAVIRVRAAERILHGVDKNLASADVRAAQRDVMTNAIAEVQQITGMPPSELGKIVESDGGLTQEGDEDPATAVHEEIQRDDSPH